VKKKEWTLTGVGWLTEGSSHPSSCPVSSAEPYATAERAYVEVDGSSALLGTIVSN